MRVVRQTAHKTSYRGVASLKAPLRFAIMIDSASIPAWATEVVRELSNSDFAMQVCVLKIKRSVDAVFSPSTIVQTSTESAFDLVGHCEKSEIVGKLKSLNLDVVLSLCAQTPSEDYACVAKRGWWRFRFGTTYEADGIGIDEICLLKKKQHVALEQIAFENSPAVDLKRGSFKVLSHSVARHQNAILAQCSSWPAAVMRQMACGLEWTKPVSSVELSAVSKTKKRFAFAMSFVSRLKFALDRVRRQFVYQRWNVGMFEAPSGQAFDSSQLQNVKWWAQSPDSLSVADPFPIYVNDRLYVLAETFNHVDHIGTISAFLLSDRGEVLEQQEAIKFPCHLSYPCLVQSDGRIYATFEALESNELAIYRCDRFPNVWTRLKVVVQNGKFADPTLFEHQGRWWIFATQYDQYSEGNSLLNAWYSETGIDGEWHPHLMNPIKCDVESSRSAGTPFSFDKKFYRPSQNCGSSYGQSVVINEIQRLTPTEFIETHVRDIQPGARFPDGIHHLGRAGRWRTIDGRRDVVSVALGFKKLWFKFKVWRRASRFGALARERRLARWSAKPTLQPQFHAVTDHSDDL